MYNYEVKIFKNFEELYIFTQQSGKYYKLQQILDTIKTNPQKYLNQYNKDRWHWGIGEREGYTITKRLWIVYEIPDFNTELILFSANSPRIVSNHIYGKENPGVYYFTVLSKNQYKNLYNVKDLNFKKAVEIAFKYNIPPEQEEVLALRDKKTGMTVAHKIANLGWEPPSDKKHILSWATKKGWTVLHQIVRVNATSFKYIKEKYNLTEEETIELFSAKNTAGFFPAFILSYYWGRKIPYHPKLFTIYCEAQKETLAHNQLNHGWVPEKIENYMRDKKLIDKKGRTVYDKIMRIYPNKFKGE